MVRRLGGDDDEYVMFAHLVLRIIYQCPVKDSYHSELATTNYTTMRHQQA